jgi:arsenate reductase-like glutaredoxin family protein
MTVIQVFGLDDSQATRAALRFFRERRIAVSYVDLRRRPMAPAELRRFTERLGARALVDTAGRAYREAGLAHMVLTDIELAERLMADPRLLRLPLVRVDGAVAAGRDEAAWSAMLVERSVSGRR